MTKNPKTLKFDINSKPTKGYVVKHPYSFRCYYMNGGMTLKGETVGERIVRFCLDHKITLYKFSQMANHYAVQFGSRITDADIYNYVNKRVSPKLDKLTAIAHTMGVSVNWLTGYEHPYAYSRNLVIGIDDFTQLKKTV